MNLLLNLPYITFDDLNINVVSIKYGWMDLCITANGKSFKYRASNITDPLNDLLEAIISIIKKRDISQPNYNINRVGDYVYVTHELEPGQVTWLFRYLAGALTLIIWEDLPSDFDELIEAEFNSQSFLVQMLKKEPDLTNELVFAMKGSIVSFVKAITKTLQNLDNLTRIENETDGHDWGFKYSIDKFNTLKEWLRKNSPSIR